MPSNEHTNLKLKSLNPNKPFKEFNVKQRITERLGDSIDKYLPENINSEFDQKQVELANIIFNYMDFYDANVNFNLDTKYKFVYTTHVLNHILK